MTQWTVFTRRTDDPKLTWLESQLTDAGILHRRNGESWHAPILKVPADQLDAAWAILDPVDDVPDDDPRFCEPCIDCGYPCPDPEAGCEWCQALDCGCPECGEPVLHDQSHRLVCMNGDCPWPGIVRSCDGE